MLWRGADSITQITQALSFLSASALARMVLPKEYTVIAFFAAMAWIGLVLAISVWCAVSFARNHFSVLWPLRLLRLTAKLTTTALFIPLSGLMMSIFSCPRDGTWAGTTLRCYEGSHLAWLLVVLVLLPMFACFSLLVAAVFFDRDWRSTSLVSKSHGRSDSAIILTQLAVTATFVLQDTLNVWVLRIVVLLAGIIVLFSVMYTLPFHKPGMNAYRASMAGLFLWASFCATLHGILDDPHTAAYTFWLGAPGALLAASQGVYMTLDRLAAKGVLCKNPYHAEIRARTLHANISRQRQYVASLNRELSTGLEERDTSADSEPGDVPVELDGVIRSVEDVYVQSIELAANSACLYLFYAQYLTSLSGARSRQKESMLLNKAEMRSPPLDIWFLMWQRRKQMEEDDSAAQQGQMNVLTRVAFDKHMKDAMVSGADARRNLVLFWGELKSRVPDLGRMYSLGGTLNDSIAKTEASFSALLHINRRNVDVLRKYAAFVMDVLNHPARAQTLLDEATAVEERASKVSQNAHGEFTFWENTPTRSVSEELGQPGILRVGHEGGQDLGKVVHVSTSMCRMLKSSSASLLGRGVENMLPGPYGKLLDAFLGQTLAGSTITSSGDMMDMSVEETKYSFLQTSEGIMVPVLSSFKWSYDGIGVAVQRVATTKGFILLAVEEDALGPEQAGQALSEEQQSISIVGVCERSAQLLGLQRAGEAQQPTQSVLDKLPIPAGNLFPDLVRGVGEVAQKLKYRAGAPDWDCGLHVQAYEEVKLLHVVSYKNLGPSSPTSKKRGKALSAKLTRIASSASEDVHYLLEWEPGPTARGRQALKRLSTVQQATRLLQDVPKTPKQLTQDVEAPISTPFSLVISPAAAPGSAVAAQDSKIQQSEDRKSGAVLPSLKEDARESELLGVESDMPGSISSGDQGDRGGVGEDKKAHPQAHTLARAETSNVSLSSAALLSREEGDAGAPDHSDAGSSHTSRKSSVETLRRLLVRRNQDMDPRLKFLRSAFFYIFVAAAGAFIVAAAIVAGEGANVVEEMGLLQSSGERLRLLMTMTDDAHMLSLIAVGGLSSSTCGIAQRVDSLKRHAAEFEAVSAFLYTQQAESLSTRKHSSIYHSADKVEMNFLTITPDQDAVSLLPSSRTMSALGATAAIVQAAQQVVQAGPAAVLGQWRPLTNATNARALEGLYTLIHSAESVENALNTTAVALNAADARMSFLEATPAAAVLCCALVFDILMVSLIAPTIRSIEEAKDSVLKTFLFLPRKLVTQVHLQATRRLVRAQRELRREDDSGEDSEDDVEVELLFKGGEALPSAAELLQQPSSVGKSTLWSGHAGEARHHTKSLQVFLKLMVRFSAPILVLLTYLAGVYAFQRVFMDNIRSVHVQVGKAEARTSLVQSISRSLHSVAFPAKSTLGALVGQPWQLPGVVEVSAYAASAHSSLEQAQHLNQQLLYGDPFNSLPGTTWSVVSKFSSAVDEQRAMSHEVSTLFLNDGCHGSSERSACLTAFDGFLSRGVSMGLDACVGWAETLIIAVNKTVELPEPVRLMNVSSLLSGRPGSFLHDGSLQQLVEGLERGSDQYVSYLSKATSSLTSTLDAVTATVCVALFFFYAVVYRPTIAQVDSDLARAMGMLLMLPGDAVRRSPVVANMIRSAINSLKQNVGE